MDDEIRRHLRALRASLTLEEKVALLTGRDSWSTTPLPSIGLRSMVLSDGPAGIRGPLWDERSPSVNFPSPTAVAASWDPAMVERVGAGLGSEAVRKGVDVVLAPTINIQRTPYGGRHFEAFSEDPLLTSVLATSYVRGIQSFGAGATVKHYVANDSETDRFTVDVRVSDRALREVYLRAFEGPVVDGGSWLVMSAYNSINGRTASENDLLSVPLNDEWEFDGVVVSDWTAVRSLESARHPQDLVMPGPNGPWGDELVRAVEDGRIPVEHVDRKVDRILTLAARVGALDDVPARRRVATVEPHAVRDTARAASIAGTVLLQNDGLLPLAGARSIALIGEGARFARTQGGGSATVVPGSVSAPLEAIGTRWPDAAVSWSLGAVVQRGVADLPAGDVTTAEGLPGMTVRYFDAEGTLILEERRVASRIVGFDPESPVVTAAAVEMSFRWRNGSDGNVARLGVVGLADYVVAADGVEVAAGSLRTGPDDDPAAAVLHPPAEVVDVPAPSEVTPVTVTFHPVPGAMPDALALGVGIPPTTRDADELIAEAAAAAAGAEIAVVVVSTSAEVESEGFDRSSLDLPGRQDDLVRAVAAANPRTVVVVNAGAPVVLPWRDEVPAILVSWFPGQEFGDALADVLSGAGEPGGRLPVTWPDTEADVPVSRTRPTDGVLDYAEGVHVGSRAWLRAGVVPAYPFGHGLGYTTWTIDEASASSTVRVGADATVALRLTNRGDRTGKTVAQVYLERVSPSVVDRPVRWLVGFASATAAAGETVAVEVPIEARAFMHWDDEWRTESGSYALRAGFSVTDLPVTLDITVEASEPVATRSTSSASAGS
ncbi:glycoside hydrolase family 3 C-terminal domain-containing protein [Agromyces tropicus]|uniref:Glycoside hydrolase family 3 C-terminal domain-containing protein n=1 Tax=Agromyces tropicus TaxID=555371 RepID=A0ABN2UFR7_9MICO